MKQVVNSKPLIKSRPGFNSDTLFRICVAVLLLLSLIIVLYPLFFIVIASISDPVLVNTGNVVLVPKNISFDGYEYVFKDQRILSGYVNTIIYSVGFTIMTVVLTLLAAYPLAKRDLLGRRMLNFLVLLPMYFGGGLVPTYITVKELGLLNSMQVMWILGALSPFNIIIARTFFMNSIPGELIESAHIDGANIAQSFFRIVLPLSKPIIAVIGLWAFVGQWNQYFNAMMYLNSKDLYPLQLILREILIQGESLQDSSRLTNIGDAIAAAEQQKLGDMIKYCVIMVATVPLLIVFPFFQRYFAQGMMIGSVKG